MTENLIVLSDAAQKLVAADISAFTRDGLRYGQYVTEMSVTHETVAAHVAIFRDAFKVAKPKADGAAVKAYATKVRNGLNRHVEAPEADAKVVDWLRLVKQAAENAQNAELSEQTIVAAVLDTLGVTVEDLATGQVA